MRKLVIALVAVLICTVLALVGCMYLNDHIKANAEEVERIDDFSVRELEQVDRSGDQLRSLSNTSSLVGYNFFTLAEPLDWRFNEVGFTSLVTVTSSLGNRTSFDIECNGGYTGTLLDNVLTCSVVGNTSYRAQIRIPVEVSQLSTFLSYYNNRYNTSYTTLTYTVYYEVIDGYGSYRIWKANSAHTTSVSSFLGGSINNSSGIFSLTFDISSVDSSYLQFIIQSFGTINIYGVKLEIGDSFTGFVYDSYLNNGYDLGHEEGEEHGFSTGYDDGYDDGYAEGYGVGHDEGFDEGFIDGLNEGFEDGTEAVQSYNNGLPTSVDENFNFTDPLFSDVDLSSGDTMDLDPGFRYSGSGAFSYDHDFGMYFSNSSGVSSITQTVLKVPSSIQTSSNYYIFAFYFTGSLYMSSSVDLVLSLGGQSYYITVQPRYQTSFVYYKVLASDLTSDIMTLTLSTPNSNVYLTRFKYQRSDYFTGFDESTSSSVSYDNGYQGGYSDGLAQGKVLGYEGGYDVGFENGSIEYYEIGFSAGDSAGYNRGYGEGLSTAQNGNWQSMLSALIGVPVSFIRGFFDFEIFGFNFLSLFKTIIAISLIVFIAKLVIFKLG